MITGGTGSFGNAVLRRFLDSDIKEIRIFSRDEKKQDDMRHALQNPKVKFYIGNVRDKQSVDIAMRGVDYVFAAATLSTLAEALKQTYAQIDPKYADTEVKIIGTRHGEKLYETLVTRKEMAKAIDMGDYYRIPCDTRDLDYDKFFVEGRHRKDVVRCGFQDGVSCKCTTESS